MRAAKTLAVAKVFTAKVFACLQTQSTTELNQKLTKARPGRRHSIRGVYTREKYLRLRKNLGVKGGRLLKGGVFSGIGAGLRGSQE